jgi:hypothetical protein
VNTHLHIIDDAEFQRLVAADKRLKEIDEGNALTQKQASHDVALELAAALIRNGRKQDDFRLKSNQEFARESVESLMKMFGVAWEEIEELLKKTK